MALTVLSQSARSDSLSSFSVLTAILTIAYHKTRCMFVTAREMPTRAGPAKALQLIAGPVAAFGIPASAWPIFFLAALVLTQRGWNFPNGQEFLSRGRGFL